jgi:hypothetical protein
VTLTSFSEYLSHSRITERFDASHDDFNLTEKLWNTLSGSTKKVNAQTVAIRETHFASSHTSQSITFSPIEILPPSR